MKRTFVSALAGLMLALSACPSWAHHRTAGADALLSNGDRHRQEQALQNALEFNRTGRGANWANPGTGHRGTVIPTRTYKNAMVQDCRKYRRSVTIDGRTAIANGTRCRTRNGVWKIARARPPLYARRYYNPYPYYAYDHYYPYIYYPLSFHLAYYFGHFAGHRRYRYRRHHRWRRFRHRRR